MASVVDTNKRVKLNTNEINLVSNNNIDILIGAGSKPQLQLLRIKEYFEFKDALKIFNDINSWEHKSNLKIYDIYIERCEYYLEFPPENFNGVFVHTTKG
mgnify:CR=1 FL=1